MPEDLSEIVTLGNTAELKCKVLYGNENNKINWSWSYEDNKILSELSESSENESVLKIQNVKYSMRGDYECTASNRYGAHSRKIKLRVKGKDNCIIKMTSILNKSI